MSGIIFLYCVQASATITSIVAICSCVCSIDWCFPCSKFKSLRRRYKNGGGHNGSTSTSTAVVTFLCHHRNGNNSGSVISSTPAHRHQKLRSTTVSATGSNTNYTSHRISLTDHDNGSDVPEPTATITLDENLINEDLSRPATSFNNPCYLLAVSTTDENGIPAVVLEQKDGESVTQV